MREAEPVERAVGMEYYASDAAGVGGRLRDRPEDFRVTEIEAFDPEPVDADPGAYPHVLLRATLSGWDTNDFASALSNALESSRERISWAGTKDKHAVTTQLFSVADADPEAVAAVDLSDADIEVLGRTGRPIFFGDLAGNAFEVTVREPERPETVDAITADLRAFAGDDPAGDGDTDGPVTVGVPNYFGQQRFGSHRPITHEVGLEVVRENWEDAVLAYVGRPSEREPEETQTARARVEEVAAGSRDWQAALDALPGYLNYERAMLHELVERDASEPEDFRAALETMPSNLQQLVVNAAQSYVFNEVLSERLARGLPFDRPVAGDVVCFTDSDAPADLAVPDTDRLQRVDEDRVDTVTRHCERGRAFVTAPLVGTETELGDGEPGEIEREVLDEVGIEPADFDLPGEFHSTGTRRAVLVRTELDIERDPLSFAFSLPKGSYATVLLREYLKVDPAELG
ncbi:tRNA pseudouridine(13) synthase TruD [Halorientalis sp. IM1011]|uniref:tRNA pseudouridine(13) synthase TruD n=1 Tax=Halorientalis sp. IM1011 TaxID=1932360 RepID=UPI00097CC6DB|nr:tRNA pseudouridine(13) synthase TruD [Halorientalis sp. IM1011]AQL42228.1 tRNA pseudouridine(13) synthase TruD [Halorientalis sp. IM1011]